MTETERESVCVYVCMHVCVHVHGFLYTACKLQMEKGDGFKPVLFISCICYGVDNCNLFSQIMA